VQETHRRLTVERDALLASLRTVQEEARRLEHEVRETRGRLEQTRADAELERQRLTTEREDIARRLDDERVQSRNVSDSLTREHAAALAVRDRENERLQHALAANTEELALTVRQRDVLRADAAELPRLRVQVDESRAENQRAFQQAPMAMFRCTKDGALIQVNRVCTVLVRRTHDELRNADFAASVFESPNDLSWLIENCLSTRRKESTETTWRRKDGSRLFVRVSAYATSSDVIECAVEDLTPVRVLQDRLSQAHRMEAVGRLAAEVAATCGNTLNGVHQNAQQWLMTTDGSSVSRQHGEMLLEEVSRAAASLRQLAAYGDAETRTPAMVDLKTVVRNLAPVLKRLAGNTVDLQLPGTSASLNVDVDAERVERLLVNIAAHGRERMPFGGRLRIELGTIVVDRHFTAKHPNVRLGPHALITITEIRNTPPADRPLRLRGEIAAPSPNAQGGAAGVDLGTLQSLVAECGGHLWMTVQPLGDMVVKVRLPLVTSYGQADPGSVASRGSRVRTLARWFQS
jgi:PAS domain-containing protein